MINDNYLIEKIDSFFDDHLYDKIISTYESTYAIINSNHTNDFYYKLMVSHFRVKKFRKVVEISKIINESYLNNSYLLCEIVGESNYQFNQLQESFKYFEKAILLNPNLKSARHRYIVLKFRNGLNLTKKDLDKGLTIALKNKKEIFLRDLSYLYYTLRYFEKANYCLEKIVEFGYKLNYIDQLTFSLRGSGGNTKNIESFSNKEEKDELFQFKHILKRNKKIVVTMSPNNKYMFQSYKFDEKFDLLHVLDKTASYYIFLYKDLSKLISEMVEKYEYEEVVLIGSSKGGTGCLLVYTELKSFLSIPINCITFSPQIHIYPFNENLNIPSYQRFISSCEINPIANHILSNTPKISDIKKRPLDKVKIIYGSGFKMDKIEAQHIVSNQDIDLIELDYNGHTTSIPYTIPAGKTYSDLKKAYANLKSLQDEDFQALGGGETIDIIDQIWKLYNDPEISLNNIL
ncbi:hypothetical protein [Psychrobacter sp. S1-30-MNA-CIBAN-0213]|uniref:hypothetical protein n=1 Tax=Psychrobacter sp. S1-30-MNA-CIBAN-0213 TaxID=3140456 RepID=UPI00332B2CDC